MKTTSVSGRYCSPETELWLPCPIQRSGNSVPPYERSNMGLLQPVSDKMAFKPIKTYLSPLNPFFDKGKSEIIRLGNFSGKIPGCAPGNN